MPSTKKGEFSMIVKKQGNCPTQNAVITVEIMYSLISPDSNEYIKTGLRCPYVRSGRICNENCPVYHEAPQIISI